MIKLQYARKRNLIENILLFFKKDYRSKIYHGFVTLIYKGVNYDNEKK